MEISGIIKGFKFKKSLGQNFLSDFNLLSAIAADANITNSDTVLEVGTGAGTLTRVLAGNAKKVISYEIDRSLCEIHAKTLAGISNTEVIFADVLKLSDADILAATGGEFKVVANLPYYITTPLIMRFVESALPLKSMTVMVQKEVALRLAAPENTADYGAITCQIRLRADVKITRTVGRQMFVPPPNVDSAVITITPNPAKYGVFDVNLVSDVIRAAFLMRRKTLVNNLSAYFKISKDAAKDIVTACGFSETVRGEGLAVPHFISIANALKK